MRKGMMAVVLTLAAIAAACSKSSSPVPAAPSTSATPPSSASGTGSASIAGTVVTTSSAMSLRPTGTGLTVSVVGTSMSASVDSSGHFTLQNVPAGDLTLAFSGNGHDARTTITGVSDRDQIRITVNLGSNSADVDDDEREHADHGAEVEGRIVSVSCNANPPSMIVGQMTQTTVLIPAGTPIRHGDTAVTCAQLTAGLRVHVKGTKNGQTVTATAITVQGEPGPAPSPTIGAEVDGTVSAITAPCKGNAISFTVMSSGTPTSVMTDANTKFEDTSCAALAVNDKVEVKGTRQGNAILAATVEGRGPDDGHGGDQHVELKGTLGAWDTSKCASGVSSTVSGKAFSTTASTKFSETRCTALKAGDVVEVTGTTLANGSVVATTVEKAD